MTMRPNVKLDREIAAIDGLSRDQLADRWTNIYGCPPPAGVRRELLGHAVAWNMQAKQLGGLSPEPRKALKAAVGKLAANIAVHAGDGTSCSAKVGPNPGHRHDIASGCDPFAVGAVPLNAAANKRSTVKAGARIVRQWNGKTNVVDVTDDGFVFEGTLYRSLSAIARKITGAHWSGPRFFGL